MDYKERRRYHGEVLEKVVLEELIRYHVIEPIKNWPRLIRAKGGQPYFLSKNGSSEQLLDEVAYVKSEDQTQQRANIVEIKMMRALDWHDWLDHRNIHKDKLIQHEKHIYNANTHGLDGVCIVAVNKDSSEYLIRGYDNDDLLLSGWDYEY